METWGEVTCPSCFELFSVQVPPVGERPCALDYDCEICCRPMTLRVESDGSVIALGEEEIG